MSTGNNVRAPRIVTGVDGSPSSVAALRWAVGQARLTHGTVDAVIAWQIPASMAGYGWVPVAVANGSDLESVARRILDEAISQATGPDDPPVRGRVVQGLPVRVLLDASDDANLLVVGSRGHGGFAGALLGSVSQHCVHHARCPVVVVRGERAGQAKAA